jgi:myo-inositol 2-dehydrogenase/D-chiro-inositol 1-dehydrogenase
MAGLGRMGLIHAQNLYDISRETGGWEIAALVDQNTDRARQFAAANRFEPAIFATVEELAQSGLCRFTVIATPTDQHRQHAATLIGAGHRVFLEKPLTGTVEEDRVFSAELDRKAPQALMLAFQRRFDDALEYARTLVQRGTIGRVFKIYSALEDSNPAPDGYRSGGILPDMSIHNVDEILWLTGQVPRTALAIGSRIYSHRLTTAEEDYDDALLCMWFADRLMAQVQVTRNHVSGYRVETTLYGEDGQIQVGHFMQNPAEITVDVFGRRGVDTASLRRVFPGGQEHPGQPEFVARYGAAYRRELATFLDCCRTGQPFPTSHLDGLRAQEVIDAGMRAIRTAADAAPLQTGQSAGMD